MAKKILFTSLKGGAGVSTFCLGLGAALAERGERVLIIDGDEKCGSILTISDCADFAEYTLADYEKGACRAKQAIVQHTKERNLYIMPALGCKQKTTAERAAAEVEKLFDFVLCDDIAESACGEAAVICEPYAPSIKCADYAVNYLKDKKTPDVGLVVNKVNGGLIYDGEQPSPRDIAALLHVKLRAAIPEDLGLPIGRMKKQTREAFAAAAENFSGKNTAVSDVIKPYYGINGYFKRKLRNGL